MKGEIAARLRERQAAALARKEGDAKLAGLRKGASSVKWSAPREVSRQDAGGLSAGALRRVAEADVSQLPVYLGFPVRDGYTLIRISKVIEQPPKPGDKTLAAQAEQTLGAADYEAYVASLKGRADISVNSANLEKSQ